MIQNTVINAYKTEMNRAAKWGGYPSTTTSPDTNTPGNIADDAGHNMINPGPART
jgi:hypothetical protein